ncbi:hypothetical protein CHUAL_003429 [Chamberlinius hualienensis]
MFICGRLTLKDSFQPVCVFAVRQIVGEDNLKKTTFKSLGIIDGKVSIRYLHRSVDQPSVQPHVEAVNFPKPSVEKDRLPKRVLNELDLGEPFQPSEIENESDDGAVSDQMDVNEPIPLVRDVVETNSSSNEATDKSASTISFEQTDLSIAQEPNLEQLEVEEQIIYLDEQKSVLFSLDDVNTKFEDTLPDNFFEVTFNEVKYLQADRKRQREELENRPMLTRISRENECASRLRKYSNAVIRINFPDRLVLQGKFQARDTVKQIEDFVRRFLVDKELVFYFYTTPPKRILQPDENIYEVPLLPTAIVHFGCEQNLEHYLAPDVIQKRSTFAAANQSSNRGASIQPHTVTNEVDIVPSDPVFLTGPSSTLSPTVNDGHKHIVQRSEGPTPKWFQMGKK